MQITKSYTTESGDTNAELKKSRHQWKKRTRKEKRKKATNCIEYNAAYIKLFESTRQLEEKNTYIDSNETSKKIKMKTFIGENSKQLALIFHQKYHFQAI